MLSLQESCNEAETSNNPVTAEMVDVIRKTCNDTTGSPELGIVICA